MGKSTRGLNNRMNGHRHKHYECLSYNGDRNDLDDDDNLLRLHLYFQHGPRDIRDKSGFNILTVLENCGPRDLDSK